MLKHLKMDDLVQGDEYEIDLAAIENNGVFIFTENDFIHWIEKEGLLQMNTISKKGFNHRLIDLNEDEIRARMGEVVNLSEWGHYWGIKDRVAHNYRLLLKSMREIGLNTDAMPDFYERSK